jgi:hypothetical protein
MVDYGPLLIALAAVGLLALLLRWAFSGGKSLVAHRPVAGHPWEYGMLVSVAQPATYLEAEDLQRRLAEGGVRCTVAETRDGPRVFVFADDEQRARDLLRHW